MRVSGTGFAPMPTDSCGAVELKRLLDSAVREYENAITRTPTDENEIRAAVDKCTSARKMLREIENAE